MVERGYAWVEVRWSNDPSLRVRERAAQTALDWHQQDCSAKGAREAVEARWRATMVAATHVGRDSGRRGERTLTDRGH
jgi:hypothetical protein